jgi:hypothetical protein
MWAFDYFNQKERECVGMWLFSQRGMFSVVQHRDDESILIVKARAKGDIEQYWPNAEIERNEEYDYLYRANLRRNEVAYVIEQMVKDINYTSYKGEMDDRPRRFPFYIRIWETLVDMQETFKDEENQRSKVVQG